MNTNTIARRILSLAGIAAVAFGLSSCDLESFELPNGESTPSSQSIPAGEVDQSNDYYTVIGKAQRDFEIEAGSIDYCPVDDLGRAGCAYGELTVELRGDAQSRGRQSIDVDPAGWGKNEKVHIPALDGVEGSRDYNGWMWNRSHLMADSLGGDPTVENLVTGTRTQNVGSVKNAGGMAYTETIARDYLDSVEAVNCPLYYAAVPNYEGDELLPRTVTVDIQSCDKSIDERVEVQNTANGFDVDYATGTFVEKE